MKAARRWLLRAALLVAPVYAPAAPVIADAFEAHVDALARDAYEHHDPALAQLRQLLAGNRSGDARRQLLQAIGGVEAQAGNAAAAQAAVDQLLALVPHDATGRAQAGANFVRAQLAEQAAELDAAAALAQSALPAFEAGCPGAPPATTACDYRSAWRARQLLLRRATSLGVGVAEAAHGRAALALAEWAGDSARASSALADLALQAHGRGDDGEAQRLMAQARRQALLLPDDGEQLARLSNAEAVLATRQGDYARALRHLEEARALAAQAAAPRLEARMLINLSDAYARLQRPADALRAAERALPIVRRHGDRRAERLLVNNAGIAKIGLGRIAEGKADLARLLAWWQRAGEPAREAETLLEFGEALAAAGQARSALELYHRERALSAALMRANRAAALQELQLRNDAGARQRDIELLERDNALKTEALALRDLRSRMWRLIAALMLLAAGVAVLLVRRVRDTNRRLAASHDRLRAQSQRDPLTNLANRRHLQDVMAGLACERGFEGALLLVDIDHFKRINDVHGHAAGDQVLVDVARRLNDAVRGGDLVVRWGGEEFLIVAPRAAPEQARQMAERVLGVLGAQPAAIGGGGAIAVTASVGYARFPLPPCDVAVPWEQAVNLADMALYVAKNRGRNRAVGIVATTAASGEALRAVEGDFERACHDGRVTWCESAGPAGTGVLRFG